MANTYVRLSGYMCDWMVAKFNSNPVDIPYTHHLSIILEKYILPNPEVRKVFSRDRNKQLSPTSVPESAWNRKLANDGGGDYSFSPSDEERGNYLAIKLPDEVYVGRELKKVTDTWQFTGAGINIFRLRVKRDFWADLDLFVQNYFRSCQIEGLPQNRNAAIEQFMNYYKIRTEFKETIIRNSKPDRNRTTNNGLCHMQMMR